MRTKQEIVDNWLPRYTDTQLEDFEDYILLTNFQQYLEEFANKYSVPIKGIGRPMQTASSKEAGITIINFGIGSANAALIMDLLGAVNPKACLFLGKCGGLKKKTMVGDFILPIAAIRGEGTSDDYIDPKVPAMPSFGIQKEISDVILEYQRVYWTGTVYTTNRRVWEHDIEFKKYLHSVRALAVDMECATLFIVGLAQEIPRGALLLVTDQPMVTEGVKTASSAKKVDEKYVGDHVQIGIEVLSNIRQKGRSVKHTRF